MPDSSLNSETKDNLFEKIVVGVMYFTGSFCVLIVSVTALLRYLFHKDLRGSEELITFAAFWMYFSGAIYAAKIKKHISAEMIELFVTSPKLLYSITLLRDALTFGLTLVCTWWAWEFLEWSFIAKGKTNLWEIPLFLGHSSVFVGFAAMCVYFARDLIQRIKNRPTAQG